MSERVAAASGARRVVKRAYRAARNLPDRLLHRRRYRDVRRRLSRSGKPRNILVVCYGNVCRSPYLQAVLQRALPETAIASAGFVGSDRPVPQASLTISAKRGLDLSRYRSRPLTPNTVGGADLIVVMDANQAREIVVRFRVNPARIVIAGDLDPRFEESRGITDPWNQSADVFEASFNRLDRCAVGLVDALQGAN
jgi:protein-tyrosine phosphatase